MAVSVVVMRVRGRGAILYLLADVPIERVYELVTDPDRATDGDP